MAFLLDTNILSEAMKRPNDAVGRRIQAHEAAVRTSVVVACELRFGVAKSGSQRLSARLEGLLKRLRILPLERPVDLHYAEIRAHLEGRGTPIGGNDLLIAAHALATDSVLVTDNEREFSRVPGLRIENWRRPQEQEA